MFKFKWEEMNKEELEKEIQITQDKIKILNITIYVLNENMKKNNYGGYICKYKTRREELNGLKLYYDTLVKNYNKIYGTSYELYNIQSLRPIKPRNKFYKNILKNH